MAFWGIEVKPGEPFTIKSENFDRSLMLTQATLGVGSSSQKTVLQVKVGDKEPIFVCTLLPEKSECFTLNLQFEEEDVTFSVVGPTSIHLSGILDNLRDEDGNDDSEIYGEDISETDSEDTEFDSEDDSNDESMDDEVTPLYLPSPGLKIGVVIEEIEDEEKPLSEKIGNKQAKKKKDEPSALELKSEDEHGLKVSTADKGKKKKKENVSKNDGKSASNLKRKVDALDQDQEPKSDAADATDGVQYEDNKKKNKKDKNKAKIEKDEYATNTKQNVTEVVSVKKEGKKAEKKISKVVEETKQSKDKPAKLKTYANGLIVEDLQPGKPNGKKASRGRKVSVRYVGKLKKDGKVFDSNISGKPFKFKLGVGQVIKGWDAGVEGMQVGGKRRLTIPPSMGYGSEGAKPQIPPNAWLLFDVELIDVA